MSEAALHTAICLGLLATAAAVFVALFFINAPYGRHVRGGWGPTISSRWGWTLMEGLGLAAFVGWFAVGAHALEPAPLALCTLWFIHYAHRSFIFPQRMKGRDRPMPISVAAMAIVFNSLNAYVNARWISQLGDYPNAWLTDVRFLAGAALFAVGMIINIQSDNILFALRKPGDTGYRIPHGGLYRWVSSPNYLGELVEWTGWAIATWSLPGVTFLLFTVANLVPRAIAHRRWYRETFADFPRERRAVIPFLL